jgi:hypothetical protein
MQGLTATHHDTWRDSNKKAREAGNTQLTGRFRRWWQVLGSNQRRLSRRFYSTLLPVSKYGLDLHEFPQVPSCGATLSAICPCPRTPIRRSARTATDTVRATRLSCPDLSAGLVPGPSRPRQPGRPRRVPSPGIRSQGNRIQVPATRMLPPCGESMQRPGRSRIPGKPGCRSRDGSAGTRAGSPSMPATCDSCER